MKKLGIIILVLLGVYGCWQVKYPSGTFRYKMTLVVDDNGKPVTSSSVREIYIRAEPRITPESNPFIKLTGEAITVDLGEKGKFFALLKNDRLGNDYGFLVMFITFKFPNVHESAASHEGISFYKNLKAKVEFPPEMLPMLVRFRDINDPKTVELVDPNDMEKSFGKGVKLVSATIEMTDEPVTKGIEQQLPWIREYYGRRLDGNRYGSGDAKNRLANDLASGAFSANMGLSKYE